MCIYEKNRIICATLVCLSKKTNMANELKIEFDLNNKSNYNYADNNIFFFFNKSGLNYLKCNHYATPVQKIQFMHIHSP